MTLPYERYHALYQLPKELIGLAWSPGRLSKKMLRDLLRRLLRHYPTAWELEQLAKKVPELLKRDDA